jgi:hypothetical protein
MISEKTRYVSATRPSGRSSRNAISVFLAEERDLSRSLIVIAIVLACPAPFQVIANSPDAGRCAKAAGEISAQPYPPDRTLIGQWGFTLGRTIYQWGPRVQPHPQSSVPPKIEPCG